MIDFSLCFSNHLKKFKFIKNLGEGGFGNISIYKCNHYKFKDLLLQKCTNKYVVKKIKKNTRPFIKSILNEWTIDKILNHDNIRKVIDIDLTNYYLIYKYHEEYMDLFDFLEKKLFILSENNIDKFITQFQSVLFYIHNIGIAHTDLKLENILIDSNYNIKLIDFGNCHVFKLNNKIDMIRGLRTTLEYASPEQFTYNYYHSDKADLWAFGIILISIILDYHPWSKAVKHDLEYLKYYSDTKSFLNKIIIVDKYKILLSNLLNINCNKRHFSFKNLLQNIH